MTASLAPSPAGVMDFVLPPELSASEPPEARGIERDEVRLLVSGHGDPVHTRFSDLARFLRAGDLLVVNTSATMPAAVDAVLADHRLAVVHFSTRLDDGTWVVELRKRNASGPILDAEAGAEVTLAGGGSLRLAGPQHGIARGGVRLWRADVTGVGEVTKYLCAHGRPITYGYLHGRWPLSDYQPVFATAPGSAEMPSAGRPFSTRLVTELVAGGVGFAPVLLHAGVSSLEVGEAPQPERFEVTATTSRLVNEARQAGGRIIAVGTTATRAIETVADVDGQVRPGYGWTHLVLGPNRPARAVDGIITGWHEPGASHLLLLEAVVGPCRVERAYAEALQEGYLWHEFGDSALLLR